MLSKCPAAPNPGLLDHSTCQRPDPPSSGCVCWARLLLLPVSRCWTGVGLQSGRVLMRLLVLQPNRCGMTAEWQPASDVSCQLTSVTAKSGVWAPQLTWRRLVLLPPWLKQPPCQEMQAPGPLLLRQALHGAADCCQAWVCREARAFAAACDAKPTRPHPATAARLHGAADARQQRATKQPVV